MNNQEKNELLQELRNDNFYEKCLNEVTNHAEKRQIMAFVEDVYLNLVEGLLGMEETIEKTLEEVDTNQIPKEE